MIDDNIKDIISVRLNDSEYSNDTNIDDISLEEKHYRIARAFEVATNKKVSDEWQKFIVKIDGIIISSWISNKYKENYLNPDFIGFKIMIENLTNNHDIDKLFIFHDGFGIKYKNGDISRTVIPIKEEIKDNEDILKNKCSRYLDNKV